MDSRDRLPAAGIGAVILVLFLLPAILALPIARGLENVIVDRPKATAGDLAATAMTATQYLVGLAGGVLGLLGLLMSDKVSNFSRRLGPRWRGVVAAGFLACAVSLWTGFVTLQLILRATADAVVRVSLERILWLHLFQFLELAVGLALIGGAVLWRIVLRADPHPLEAERRLP